MYAKCGIIGTTHQVFDKMPERDVVSCNAMIVGYVKNGYSNEALTLLYQLWLFFVGITHNSNMAKYKIKSMPISCTPLTTRLRW